MSLSGLESQQATKQVLALTLCFFFRETITIVNNLELTNEQKGKPKEIVFAIQRYVEGQINESVECQFC